MAARSKGSGAVTAFIVGALLVIVLGVGWMVWSAHVANELETAAMDVDLKLPKAPDLPSPAPLPNAEPLPLLASGPG